MKNNKKGFTLIELLVVIAIIGLLSTLAVVALNNARQKSRDARRVSDIKQIQTALELSYNDNNAYPATVATGGNIGEYMSTVPSNPDPRTDGGCADADYVYAALASNTSYTLTYCLGATTGGIIGGTPQTATPAGIQ